MSDPADRYRALRGEAAVLAGTPADIRRRAVLLHQMYLDSGGNHAFAEIAVHGALWGYRFFEVGGTLGHVVKRRYFYHRAEMARRHAMLGAFADGFKEANRSVFIDTYANFYFTRGLDRPGDAADALRNATAGEAADGEATDGEATDGEAIDDDVTAALFAIHAAGRSGERLDAEARKDLFRRVLRWEQTTTVGPKVSAEVAKFDCPILRACVLRPPVRFAYFPRWTYFLFRDFSDTEERVRKAHRCFDLGEAAGWPRVFESMRSYRVLPEAFFADPPGFAAELKRRPVERRPAAGRHGAAGERVRGRGGEPGAPAPAVGAAGTSAEPATRSARRPELAPRAHPRLTAPPRPACARVTCASPPPSAPGRRPPNRRGGRRSRCRSWGDLQGRSATWARPAGRR